MTYSPTKLQLTHVLQQLYRRLGGVVTLATDGAPNLAIDTKLEEVLGEGNVDGFLNSGTLIVVQDAGGTGAAPEGEFSPILSYDSTATAITLSNNLTAAIAVGDKVLYAGADFPLYDVIEVVNDALKYLGVIPLPDTSLTTASNQTEYPLPAAITGRDLLDVEVQTVTGNAVNNLFTPVENYRVIPSAVGSSETLVIPQLPAGYTLRLTYGGIHPKVTAYDGNISEYLHPDLVHAAVLAHVVQWKNDNNSVQGSPDNATVALEQKAWSQFDRARILHPVHFPIRRIQGMPHWNTLNNLNGNTFLPYYGV